MSLKGKGALLRDSNDSGSPHRFANRLVHEKSPYLLQHAHNPVDWYPWGEEAFARARRENRPIFLSVGYSTCHWCHVMERESFEDEGIARLLNERFVSIKVDREERPDVDRVYMTFVQAATGSGGWPMSVWLTPDLKPFLGGTYFPPADYAGRPGFATVLAEIARRWEADRERLVEQADRVMSVLREHTRKASGDGAAVPFRNVAASACEQFAADFDERHGGFGGAPRFPRPAVFNFLFRAGADAGCPSQTAQRARRMAWLTLRRMADGGIHDRLGGGFHRYSVDVAWHVPHFEKMLYDQAQLAMAYLEAGQVGPDPVFFEVARDILDYVLRDLTGPGGAFHSAEDADSPVAQDPSRRAEGAFYVWTKEEIVQALGEADAGIFSAHYGVEPGGNVPAGHDPHGELAGKNILIQRQTAAETARHFKMGETDLRALLARCRRRLFEVRSRRPRPHVDDKIVTAWNGLMISAFARAGAVLGEPVYLRAAARAADFFKEDFDRSAPHRLVRAHREGPGPVPGFLADHVFLVQGLLDLYEASFDPKWLAWALELQEIQDALFWDAAGGAYRETSGRDPSILLQVREEFDSAEPSPNSVAALNLLRLGSLFDSKDHLARAGQILGAFARAIRTTPVGLPQMLVAGIFRSNPPLQVVIAGRREAPDTRALIRAVHRRYQPNRVLALADGGEGQRILGARAPWFRSIAPIDGRAAVYVCRDRVCRQPVTDAEVLEEALENTSRYRIE